MNITIAIPAFNLNKDRLKNLIFICQNIKKANIPFFVIEQISNNKKTNVKLFCEENDIQYHSELIRLSTKIHKSRLINKAAELIKSSYFGDAYMWINDVDCYLKYSNVLEKIDNNYKFIQPYFLAKRATKEESENIYANTPTPIDFTIPPIEEFFPEKNDLMTLYSALTFIVNVDAFIKIGGMDEDFIGWGHEDTEFAYRVLIKEKQPLQILDIYAVHLWHEDESIINKVKNSKPNKNIIKEKYNMDCYLMAFHLKELYKDYDVFVNI